MLGEKSNDGTALPTYNDINVSDEQLLQLLASSSVKTEQ